MLDPYTYQAEQRPASGLFGIPRFVLERAHSSFDERN